jgi:hypothetical protein
MTKNLARLDNLSKSLTNGLKEVKANALKIGMGEDEVALLHNKYMILLYNVIDIVLESQVRRENLLERNQKKKVIECRNLCFLWRIAQVKNEELMT